MAPVVFVGNTKNSDFLRCCHQNCFFDWSVRLEEMHGHMGSTSISDRTVHLFLSSQKLKIVISLQKGTEAKSVAMTTS